jgi:hypothetical protein
VGKLLNISYGVAVIAKGKTTRKLGAGKANVDHCRQSRAFLAVSHISIYLHSIILLLYMCTHVTSGLFRNLFAVIRAFCGYTVILVVLFHSFTLHYRHLISALKIFKTVLCIH